MLLRVSGDLGPGVQVLQWAQVARGTAILPGLAAVMLSDAVNPDPAMIDADGRVRRGPALRWSNAVRYPTVVELDGLGRVQPIVNRASGDRAVAKQIEFWSVQSVTYRNPYDATLLAIVSLVTGGNIINVLTWLSTRKNMRRAAALETDLLETAASGARAKSAGEIAELESSRLRQLAEARRFHAEASRLEVDVALDIVAYYDEHQPGHRWDLATALLLVRGDDISAALTSSEAWDLKFSLVPSGPADGHATLQTS